LATSTALLLATLTACGGTADAADTQRPTAPGGVTAQASSATSVHVMWNRSSDNRAITGYEVYRKGKRVTSVAATRQMTDVDGLTPSTAYTFTVRARDAADTSSPGSNDLDLTTPSAPGAPANTAPTELRTDSRVQGKEYVIDLDWKQPDTGGEIPAYQLFIDGRLTTTIVWGGKPPKGRASYRLTVGDPRGTRYSMKIRAKLPDGKWGDFSARRTVVLGG
jgi:chitodextrinase